MTVNQKIVIVVPIFNAFEILKKCLVALDRYTDLSSSVSIVLINDSSTDPRVSQLLQEYNKANWTIIENRENLGFPKTANIGLGLDKEADVVLLNSDVIVGPDWLSELEKVAQSSDDVATVTALSNSASDFSWPQNQLQLDVSPDFAEKIAEVISASSSIAESVEIPVGVGHCLYLKREALECVGYFDEHQYGVGYGEEVQFCLRARRAGFRHLLACRCYVFHKGSASMETVTDVQLTCSRNNTKIRAEFPEFQQLLKEFRQSNSFWNNHRQISEEVLNTLCGNMRRILYVLHNSMDVGKIGGVEFHVSENAEYLRDQNAVFILGRRDETRWDLKLLAGDLEYNFHIGDLKDGNLQQLLLSAIAPHIVHYHHFKNLPLEFVSEVFRRGIPSLLTVHDYYMVCPNYCLIGPDGSYCGLPDLNSSVHKSCLVATGMFNLDLEEWRATYQSILNRLDQTIFVSETAQTIFCRELKPNRPKIIPCGIEYLASSQEKKGLPESFSVCFLGVGAANKGQSFVSELALLLAKDGIEVHFLGSTKSDWNSLSKFSNVHIHGYYRPNEAVSKLRMINCSIACLLSPWPETFSRTLSEVWAAGIPALVSKNGAPAERVVRSGAGWVLPDWDLSSTVEKIRFLRDNPEEILRAGQSIRKGDHPSAAEVARLLSNEYEQLTSSTNANPFSIEKLWNKVVISGAENWSASIPDTPFGFLLYFVSLVFLEKTPSGRKESYNPALAYPPEFLMVCYGDTKPAKFIGIVTMIYLRFRSVGFKKTISRPLIKCAGIMSAKWQQLT